MGSDECEEEGEDEGGEMELASIYAGEEEGGVSAVHSNPLHAAGMASRGANVAPDASDTDSLLLANVNERLQQQEERQNARLQQQEERQNARLQQQEERQQANDARLQQQEERLLATDERIELRLDCLEAEMT